LVSELTADVFVKNRGYDSQQIPENGPLPENFFTKYLQKSRMRLKGAEDIKSIKATPTETLKQYIHGIERGEIYFEEMELIA